MNKLFLIAFVCTSMQSLAQKKVKIVFDLTSADTVVQKSTIRHVSGMAEADPRSSFEVVVYGGALPMVIKGKSRVADGLQKLENNPNVSIFVCELALKDLKIDKALLLKKVETVPNGILEIADKQAQGWSYIKEAR